MTGLEHRYNVSRVDGKDKIGIRYFVLDPANDPAAYDALIAYASATTNSMLAEDLYNWIEELDMERYGDS